MSGPPLWLTRVQSDSMEPGLNDGQLVWTIRPRQNQILRRGAVLVVDSSELGIRVVKRLIGLPGEHVSIENGQVRVDGQPLVESYARPSQFRGDFEVPDGHFLVLGDNRDASSDSRSWSHPYVPRVDVVGILLRPLSIFRGRC